MAVDQETNGEMDPLSIFRKFLEKAAGDPRIGIAHIGLYAVLLSRWIENGANEGLQVYGKEGKVAAKVYSLKTYYKLIKELSQYGYINYRPSFCKQKPSIVIFK